MPLHVFLSAGERFFSPRYFVTPHTPVGRPSVAFVPRALLVGRPENWSPMFQRFCVHSVLTRSSANFHLPRHFREPVRRPQCGERLPHPAETLVPGWIAQKRWPHLFPDFLNIIRIDALTTASSRAAAEAVWGAVGALVRRAPLAQIPVLTGSLSVYAAHATTSCPHATCSPQQSRWVGSPCSVPPVAGATETAVQMVRGLGRAWLGFRIPCAHQLHTFNRITTCTPNIRVRPLPTKRSVFRRPLDSVTRRRPS